MQGLTGSQRDLFDERYSPARRAELSSAMSSVMSWHFTDPGHHILATDAALRVLREHSVEGVLEAGYGGRLVDHFLARVHSMLDKMDGLTFVGREKSILAIALAELSMCSFARHARLDSTALSALWRAMKTSAESRPESVFSCIARVLEILDNHRKRGSVACALLWCGAVVVSAEEAARTADADLAAALGLSRETFARKKSAGLDLLLLLCLVGMST